MSEVRNDLPTDGVSEQPAGGVVEARFTQEDVNRIAAKERRAAQQALKELEDARAKLTAIENEKKSEQERAIEAARKAATEERDKHWISTVQQREIDYALRESLIQQGLDPDLSYVVKAKTKIDSVDDIAGAIKEAMEGKDWIAPKRVQGQSGTPSGVKEEGSWTPERMQRVLASRQGRGFTDEEWQQIKRSGM